MNESQSLRFALHGIGLMSALLVLVAGYFLGYVPRMINSRAVHHEKERVAQIASSAPMVRRSNANLHRECELMEHELTRLREGVSSEAHEHELLRTFSELAKASNLRMLDFSPTSAGEDGDFGVTLMQIGFRGSYEGTCSLLWKLDELPRLHRIVSITVRLVDQERGVFETRFSLRAFHKLSQPVTFNSEDGA